MKTFALTKSFLSERTNLMAKKKLRKTMNSHFRLRLLRSEEKGIIEKIENNSASIEEHFANM